MSEAALQMYEEGLRYQHNRNEARRIRSRVTEARRSPHSAGIRWPFELLQNALDAGPRKGRPSVTVRLNCLPSKVVFEHDGAPFTSIELAALLSGGSSKEFESDVTTGRFGTGFLVTHVLAEQTAIRALLEVQNDYERFDLVLDRSGDEEAILANIQSCNAAIRAATSVTNLDVAPSAAFEYLVSDSAMLTLGTDALRQALPYLYATRPNLGRVEVGAGLELTEVWTPGETVRESFESGFVEHRVLRVERNGRSLPEMRIFRFLMQEETSAALVLLEKSEERWKVVLPEPNTPRVYREYPIRGSGFLPAGFVLDGKFEPDQERSRLLMGDGDKKLLEEAFAACLLSVKYAFSRDWIAAHLLARVSDPRAAFDPTDANETHWWTEQLAAFAKQLAELPIVECASGFLPAISSDRPRADFVFPCLLSDGGEHETTVGRIWPLIEAATDLCPPRKEVAVDWTEIADGWHGLGLRPSRISINQLGQHVRKGADRLDQLHVNGDPMEWLASFLDAVGECWSKRAGVDLSAVSGMLPNQHRQLCSPEDLRRDGGVSDSLKDISAALGQDVRVRLFLVGFHELGEALKLSYLDAAIDSAIRESISENNVIDDAIKHIRSELPEDKDIDGTRTNFQIASIRLAGYLWERHGKEAALLARQIPLITLKNRAVRWGPDRMMMAPVCTWGESARSFVNAYPPARVLSDVYAGNADEGIPNTVSAFVEWGIAIQDPITSDTPAELKDRRLAAISSGNTDGIVVSGETFSQIALLQPEVLNRCQEGKEEARALLGLVLCHVVRHDARWQEERLVKGHRAGAVVDVRLRAALWLADLRFRSWVPVLEDDGKSIKAPADATTLKALLDPKWLEKNDAAIRLLSESFGFDQLELRLLGVAPDAQTRQELRNGLAKLVESAGADPGVYASLAADIEARQRRSLDIARCRLLGSAVQSAVRTAMEQRGLSLKLVDRGFDYEVTLATGNVLDDAASRVQIGPYLLEIKATTTGGPRLTPKQAETVSHEPSNYILCVVDLRELTDADLDNEWTASRVEPLAKIVSNIGDKVEETCLLVEEAKSNSVGIRNDSALRYEVPVSVWEAGSSISQWVAVVSERLAKYTE